MGPPLRRINELSLQQEMHVLVQVGAGGLKLGHGLFHVGEADSDADHDTAILRDDFRNKQSNSTGLKNITFRMEKVMGAKVEIESTLDIGTTVTIILPKEKKGNESDYC